MLAPVKGLLAGVLISCAGPRAAAPIANRGVPTAPAIAEPMLGAAGLRVPITKAAIEALLPGATAHVTDESTVVELPGVPRSELVYKGVPAGIAMLILERGEQIHVFAREVTMSHGLSVGMTLEAARTKQPTLACFSDHVDETCRIPAFPNFAFRIFIDVLAPRIDHVIWIRRGA
jgi:hypothetical protein